MRYKILFSLLQIPNTRYRKRTQLGSCFFPPFAVCQTRRKQNYLGSMDSEANPPGITSTRHKCSACYKQYKKNEHLIEHMKSSYHSVHQPKCGVCGKHCKSFESLREHLTGPMPRASCGKTFTTQGCNLCMKVFDTTHSRDSHKEICRLSPTIPMGPVTTLSMQYETELTDFPEEARVPEAVAMDCEMVGGGSDGSLNLCARVCLIDEGENVIFHTFVQPQIPVTDYRYEITGITEEHLKDAMALKQVQEKILEILYNGEAIWKLRLDGGKARLLVGHSLDHDLNCLRMDYPEHLWRDTASYPPLMKTNLVSHSLKYLTKTYLGYDIQLGIHDPYEDSVAAMNLYKRMRAQDHPKEEAIESIFSRSSRSIISFDSLSPKELKKMSPDTLFQISRSNFYCWCLDSRPKLIS